MSDAKAEESKPKAGNSSKLLIIIVALNTLIAGGTVAFTLLRAPPPPAAKGEHGAEAGGEKGEENGEHGAAPAARPMARIENIVVRLRNPEVDRYARITLEIELTKISDVATFQSNLPKVRDSVISTVADRTAEQLTGSPGMIKLKGELVEKISEALGADIVKAVYLSDFVVQ